jgi:hypothetical protein
MVGRAATDAPSVGRNRRPGPRALRGDTRGHFLVVSGVLLVVGFVLFSTTLSHSVTLEEATERAQGGDLVHEVDALMAAMDRAVADQAWGGELNVTEFAAIARAVERAAHDHAARSGIFASVRLALNPDLETFWRADRCLGYDPDESSEGVIVGWDRDSLEHSIVGAVYEVHVSDGSRSLRFAYYVQLRPCAADEIYTHARGWSSTIGLLTNLPGSHVLAGQMDLTEEQDWSTLVFELVRPSINTSSYLTHHWSQAHRIAAEDGQSAVHPSQSTSRNYLGFSLIPPARLKVDDRLEEVTVQVVARHDVAPVNPQDLYLRVWPTKPANLNNPPAPAISRVVGPLSTSLQTFNLNLPTGPQGAAGWGHAEIENAWFEFTVLGTHNPNRKIEVDYFKMEGGFWTFSAYRMNVRLEWPAIPPVYGDHELALHYRVAPGTPAEGFRLEVRDAADPASEWTLVHNMTDTSGEPDGVRIVAYPSATDPALPNRMEFRIVDTDHADNWDPEDEDTVEIIFMRIVSRLGS